VIRLNPLLGLVWVARHQSYAAAARSFPYPISQPGLHQQVRSLEKELGTVLFSRVAKDRVVLTTAGRALFELADPFVDQLGGLLETLSLGDRTLLRVQSSGLVLRGVVAPAGPRLRALAPSIELRIEEIRRPTAASVLRGDTDLLVDFVPDLPPGVDSIKVATASAFLIVPKTTKTAARIRLAAMGNADMVAYPEGTVHRRLQESALENAQITPGRITEASSADSIIALVAAGLGYSIVPWLDPTPPKARNIQVQRVGRRGVFPIRAVFRSGDQADPAVAAALESLK